MRSGLSRGALAALAMLVASAGTAAAGITTEVPEPTSFALLAAALGGAALIKLRRRK